MCVDYTSVHVIQEDNVGILFTLPPEANDSLPREAMSELCDSHSAGQSPARRTHRHGKVRGRGRHRGQPVCRVARAITSSLSSNSSSEQRTRRPLLARASKRTGTSANPARVRTSHSHCGRSVCTHFNMHVILIILMLPASSQRLYVFKRFYNKNS